MADVIVLLEGLRPRTVLGAPIVARGAAVVLDVVVFTFVVAGGSTLLATAAALVGAPGIASVLEALLVTAALLVLQLP